MLCDESEGEVGNYGISSSSEGLKKKKVHFSHVTHDYPDVALFI